MSRLNLLLKARDGCCPCPSASPSARSAWLHAACIWRPRVAWICQQRGDTAGVVSCSRKLFAARREELRLAVDAIESRPAALALAALSLLAAGPALALTHAEPANALSVPTWIIHISSVIEWTSAMLLVWKYAEVTGNEKWKGLTWGMMPLFAGALCACTYHLFYNSPQLDFLVALQASLTWIGNATLWAAAYRIYRDAQQPPAPS